jgi:hypothetical protein
VIVTRARHLLFLGPMWLILAAGVLFATSTSARAASLSITPLRTELSLVAGQTINGTIKLRNSGRELITVALGAETFAVTNEDYDYRFEKNKQADWVNYEQPKIELQPREVREAAYSVAVPVGAEPGGHYIALIAAIQPAIAQTDGLTTIDRVASLLYIDLPGESTKQGSLAGFDVPILAVSPKLYFVTQLRNTGTTHFRSNAVYSLKTLWGTALKDQTSSQLLLPQSLRRSKNWLAMPYWPGIYTVQAKIGLGGSTNAQVSRHVIYMPAQGTLTVAGGILAVVLLVVTTVKAGRRRKS